MRGVDTMEKEVTLFMKHGVEAKDYENVNIRLKLILK